MGILLSDGEIVGAIDIANGGKEWREGWGLQDVIEEQDRSIAKAQLKKVVELGKRPIGNAILTCAHDIRIDLEEFWKALLKEIE